MNAEMDIGTNKKAFQINLDAKKYGTFAEIGAARRSLDDFSMSGALLEPSPKLYRPTT